MVSGKGFSKRKVVFLTASSLLVMVSITGILGAKVLPMTDSSYRFLALFEEVLSLVRYNYVEPVDGKKLMRGAYKGAAEALDPYGAYLTPDEMKAQKAEKEHPAGSIGVDISKRFGYIVVVSTQDSSPASAAGIRSGDYIITLDDRSSSDLSVGQATDILAGPVGSKLRLSVIRRSSRTGEPEDIELTRAEIPRPETRAETRDGVLMLRLRDLSPDVIAKVKAECAARPKAPVLLDLRNCTSDSVKDAVALADLFLDEGDIVKVQDRRKGESSMAATKGPDTIEAPLYILINRGSAGGSEIVAAAFKHYHRAKVLGERSFGRAAVQEVVPLSNGGGLRVSVAKYLEPGGAAIQGNGVDPDEKIAEPDRAAANGEDTVLDKALEYIHKVDAGAAPAKAA